MGINRTSYFTDVIAIASLSAIEKGIFVVYAGSNYGNFFQNSIQWSTLDHNGRGWHTIVPVFCSDSLVPKEGEIIMMLPKERISIATDM